MKHRILSVRPNDLHEPVPECSTHWFGWDGAGMRPYECEHVYLARDYDALLSRLSVLEGALRTFDAVANEAARLNDADHIKGNAIKAHKMLMALAGLIPGYRADVDAARAAIASTETQS